MVEICGKTIALPLKLILNQCPIGLCFLMTGRKNILPVPTVVVSCWKVPLKNKIF